MHTTKKKGKEKKPRHGEKPLAPHHINHYQIQHPDYERGSPNATLPRREHCASNIVAR
jgi:hypothetical protein